MSRGFWFIASIGCCMMALVTYNHRSSRSEDAVRPAIAEEAYSLDDSLNRLVDLVRE
jgi:hypothetical protein